MTVFYKNTSIRAVALGLNTARATAVPPTVAQSPQTIFTVTGGRIQLVGLLGEVTTVIGANAQTLKVSSLASAAGAAALDLCAASASIANFAVGTHFALPAAVATGLLDDHTTLSGIDAQLHQMVIPAGAITITSTATNTGSIKWDLYYIPLDVNTIVAAA